MKIYKWGIYISFPLSIVAIVTAFILNEYGFTIGSNAMLGVFGSGVLTFLTTLIGYRVERRKGLESFLAKAQQLISIISKYEGNTDTENKIRMGYCRW